jgi:hypothetical protein
MNIRTFYTNLTKESTAGLVWNILWALCYTLFKTRGEQEIKLVLSKGATQCMTC